MNGFSLCGIALLCYAALLILGKEKNSLAALVGLAGTLCLFGPAILSLTDLSKELAGFSSTYGFFGSDLLFRAFGIGFCCQFTSDICRDAGYGTVGDALDFSCKVAILSLCLPLWKELFSLIGGLVP
jgi:stage III sporulation protein AD